MLISFLNKSFEFELIYILHTFLYCFSLLYYILLFPRTAVSTNNCFKQLNYFFKEPTAFLSYSHSRKIDLPVTRSSPFGMWLIILFFFSAPANTTLSWEGYGVCLWRRQTLPCNCHSPIFCVLYCKHQPVYEIYLFFFYAYLSLWFLDEETNPDPRRPATTV